MKIPDHYRLQYSQEQITKCVSSLGSEITTWADKVSTETNKDVLAIPLLRGGIFFLVHLLPKVACSIEMMPGRAKAYDTKKNIQLTEVEVNIEGVDVQGRSVLIVDDICDSGRTLKIVKEHLLSLGANDVKTAVLIHRIHEASVFKPDWVGFEHEGAEWFVGFGMDDQDRWSNLPAIYVIDKAN